MIEIRSKFKGTIPLDADWIQIARELNTVLLSASESAGCSELHVFAAAPMPLAFTMGMGLDTRVNAVVYQWRAPGYVEVFRSSELGDPAKRRE